MGTNRPNLQQHAQQQARQQQQQQSNTPPVVAEEEKDPKKEHIADMRELVKKETAKSFDLLIRETVKDLIDGKLSPQDATKDISAFVHGMPSEFKDKLIADREQLSEEINRMRNCVEVVAQAIPYILHT